jgi:hypothetical protein
MTEENKHYEASVGSDGRHFVRGPGDGLGYYSGTLWPDLRCESKEEAERGAKIANIAHREGYMQAQRDIKKALGL